MHAASRDEAGASLRPQVHLSAYALKSSPTRQPVRPPPPSTGICGEPLRGYPVLVIANHDDVRTCRACVFQSAHVRLANPNLVVTGVLVGG